MLIWKIAWRNLWRHKGKSLVIGVILFLGALLMTVGDALVRGANQGLEENMVKRFTGHLVLVSANEKKNSVFFTNQSLKVLPDYLKIKTALQGQDFIDGFLPMTRGIAMLLHGGETESAGVLAFGVNFEEYQQMFLQNVTEVEGTLLRNGERGILISDKSREMIFDDQNFWVVPEGGKLVEESLTPDAQEQKANLELRSDLVFLGIGAKNLENDIRLPVKGIFRFRTLNKAWAGTAFMDIESYRECFGYVTAADKAAELTESQKTALAAENEDALFTDTNVVQDTVVNTETYDLQAMQQQTQRAETKLNLDEGAYNLVTVRLKPGISVAEGQERLRRALADAQANVKILTWKQAAGEVSQYATMTQGALYVFVIFIFFVAVIVIMNTLSMAAIERANEIGMMRAIGARKGFISKMFFAETSLLALAFGGLGVLFGVVTVWVVAALNISVMNNEFLSLLFGGDTIHPIVGALGFVSGTIQLAIVTILAMIYPIRVARKITPLEAISRD
jgi:ABC-type lipoprotein release transport system permease subunit